MIFISTMERKDKFKTYRQIIIFFIILEMLGILFNGGIQQISYLYTKINVEKYIMVDAKVLNNNTSAFKIFIWELIPTSKTLVQYTINNVEYQEWTLLYPRNYEDEKLVIAVSKEDYSQIARMESYEINNVDKEIYLKTIMVVIILITIMIFLNFVEKRDNNVDF